MSHYTKLWDAILYSTIWDEENHVRILWITMLAMCDSGGYVGAAVPGLCKAARLHRPQVDDALKRLMSPDKDSRTKDHDGRRIAEADGGWIVLNYEKHREASEEAIRREQNRQRQHRWRLKRQAEEKKLRENAQKNANVTLRNVVSHPKASLITQAEAEAEAFNTDAPAAPAHLSDAAHPHPQQAGGGVVPTKKTKGKKTKTEALPDVPLSLATPEFLAAWEDWVEHRREIKHKLTPRAARQQLHDCEEWGATRAVAAIRNSIGGGYQKLCEPWQPRGPLGDNGDDQIARVKARHAAERAAKGIA
jgi:hypothetical protein